MNPTAAYSGFSIEASIDATSDKAQSHQGAASNSADAADSSPAPLIRIGQNQESGIQGDVKRKTDGSFPKLEAIGITATAKHSSTPGGAQPVLYPSSQLCGAATQSPLSKPSPGVYDPSWNDWSEDLYDDIFGDNFLVHDKTNAHPVE